MRAWWGVTPLPRDWNTHPWYPRHGWYYEKRYIPPEA